MENSCRVFHETGDQDFFKERGTELLDSFIDPLVIRHPKGHTIPRFGNTIYFFLELQLHTPAPLDDSNP